jgi:membrane protein
MKLPKELRGMRAHKFGSMLKDSFDQWSRHRASSKGAALALYMIFSLAPMLILVIAVAGLFFGNNEARDQLMEQVRNFAGDSGADAIRMVLMSAQQSGRGTVAAVVSIGVLIFSATTAFAELQASLDEMWEVDKANPEGVKEGVKGFVRTRLLAFGLVLVLALFLLAALTFNAALAAARAYYGDVWGSSAFSVLAGWLANVFSFAVLTALFAVVYKMLPSIQIGWRDVTPGAIMTAVLFLIGKWGIGLYLSSGGVASSYGAAGSVIALLLWIYYSAQIFFFGAVVTRQFSERFGTRAWHVKNAA